MAMQTRMCIVECENDRYMNYSIWQPTDTDIAWHVSIKGWIKAGQDITIYHKSLPKGRLRFTGLKFKSGKAFAAFVTKMLMLYRNAFKRDYIKVDIADYQLLIVEYERGKEKANNLYINSGNF